MKFVKHFSVNSITKKNIPFIIGWIIIFIWLYAYFLPFGSFKFESNLYNLKLNNPLIFTLVWLIAFPTISVLFDGRKYIPYTFYSVIFAMVSFVVLRFTPVGIISEIILCIASVCMGHIFASSCYAFFMILNNAEKFYSIILAIVVPKAFLALKPIINSPNNRIDISSILIFVLIIILLICTFINRNNIDILPLNEKTDTPPPKKVYSLLLLVFAVFTLNDVIAPTLISITLLKLNILFEPIYFMGIVSGAVLILLCQKIFYVSLYNMLNLSFVFAALGFVSSALSVLNGFYGTLSFLFFGLSYVLGFVNIYYLAGLMIKKFQSIFFYRILMTLLSVFYFLAIFAANLFMILKNEYYYETLAFSTFTSIVILIIVLFSTPFFIKNLNSEEWMDDSYRIDITHETRLNAKLKDFGLAPREIETCQKLLAGCTLRQIAALMGISFSTVNTYCNNIYKKLNINSRIELLVLLKEYQSK